MKKVLTLFLLILLLAGCAAPADRDGVVIALLDTGISTEAIPSDRILPGWNYVRGNDDTQDRVNHGTAVASIILGCESAGVEALAPEAMIVPLVVLDKDGQTQSVTPEVLAQAIRDAVDQYGADIINISLGIKSDSPQVRAAAEYAEKRGVLIISAVGNEGESADLYYPAAYDTVLAVGSHDKNNTISDFSQRNGTVQLLAPGEDIWLASRNGKTYGTRGTSYSTGYVSAAAARLLIRNPDLAADDLRQMLLASPESTDGIPILTLPE